MLPDEEFHPNHCFCQIEGSELNRWIIKRYRQHRDTVDLLREAKNDHERELISIVALLDVDDETLLSMMDQVDFPDHHILHCRAKVRTMITNEITSQ